MCIINIYLIWLSFHLLIKVLTEQTEMAFFVSYFYSEILSIALTKREKVVVSIDAIQKLVLPLKIIRNLSNFIIY